jgi:hypothetical protein
MKLLMPLGLMIILLAGGCEPASPELATRDDGMLIDVTDVPLAQAGDLSIAADIPRTALSCGDVLPVTITVTNHATRPVRIDATSSRHVYVQIWRETDRGWTVANEYPEIEFPVVSPWGLAGNSNYTHTISVPVELDWPTHQPLQVKVVLNGTDLSSEPVTVTVTPQG